MVLSGLGEKRLRKRDRQIGPVNPFPLRGSPLTSKITEDGFSGLGEKRLTIELKQFSVQLLA